MLFEKTWADGGGLVLGGATTGLAMTNVGGGSNRGSDRGEVRRAVACLSRKGSSCRILRRRQGLLIMSISISS